jgi:protein ImuA
LPFPSVEVGRLHEVLGDGGASGVGVILGWLAEGRASQYHVWIGRRAWSMPTALHRTGKLGDALLIDVDSTAERAWAAELCVRCSAVAAVVADGRGFDLTMTRRLQLAARGRDCRLVVLRPAGEGGSSAAGSRWRVSPTPAVAANGLSRHPRWSVELLRSKGGHFTSHGDDAAAGARPAGLRTAGEMFCDENDVRTLGLGTHA